MRTAGKAMSSDFHPPVLNALGKGFSPKGCATEDREEY